MSKRCPSCAFSEKDLVNHFKGEPPHHPPIALAATRAVYAIERDDSAAVAPLVHALFTAGYVDGLDTGKAEDVLGVAQRLGHDRAALAAAIESPEIKGHAKAMSEQAIERGVFGSPWMFVDGEPFWGWDRLPMLDDWLARAGWSENRHVTLDARRQRLCSPSKNRTALRLFGWIWPTWPLPHGDSASEGEDGTWQGHTEAANPDDMEAARRPPSHVDDTARRPVVAGTDVKVSQVASEYEHLEMTPDQIVEAHPHLTLADVHAALAYYYDHQDTIHREWREADSLIVTLRTRFASRLRSDPQ